MKPLVVPRFVTMILISTVSELCARAEKLKLKIKDIVEMKRINVLMFMKLLSAFLKYND